MARVSTLQNQFTKGELSPRMNGRTDLEQYYQGAAALQNWLPLPHGGIVTRPGLVFAAETGDSSTASRVVPFVFSLSDAYILEFGATTMRVYRNQARVQSGDISYTAFNGTFADFTDWTDESSGGTAAADANGGQMRLTGDASEIAIGEHDLTTASTTSEHTIRFKIVGASVTDTVELRIGTATDLEDILTGAEFGNGYHTVNFTPTSASTHIQFRNNADVVSYVDNVYIMDNEPIQLETPYAAADLMQLQYVQDSDTMWIVHPSYKPMKLTRSDHEAWSLISYTPTTDPFTSATTYPATVAFFEQRLVFGYTSSKPQRLYFSKSGDVNVMTTGTGDSDGFVKDIFATQANPIRWIVGGTDLIVGTIGGEWAVDRPSSSAVTVSNFAIKRRTRNGVANVRPAEVEHHLLFVARRGQASNAGTKIREFRFEDSQNEYVAPDQTLLSNHIAGTGSTRGFTELAWQEQAEEGSYESADIPGADRVLWCVRSDGVMGTLTYNPDELVVAWARQVTDGTFESVAVVPGAGGDEVWAIVNRTINGSTVRYVEYMDPDVAVDSAISGTAGTATVSWSGFGHLEGEELTLLADDGPVNSKTVVGGAITLDKAATTLVAGLAFTPEVQLMPLEVPLNDGPSTGAAQSVAKLHLRFLNSVGARVTASNAATGDDMLFREVGDNVEDPIPAFTGVKPFVPPHSWIDPIIKITQPNPLPCCILSITAEMEATR